jgi:opacity protein-like surface antigen
LLEHPGMRHRTACSAAITASLLTVAACADVAQPEEDFVEVDDGKADDFYSNVAAEWEVRGSVLVKMTDAEFADQAKRKSIVERRLTAVGLYLTAYVTDKFEGIDINNDGRIGEDEIFFRNDGYGGFHAMVRTQSGEVANLTKKSADTYELKFELDVAGPKNLTQLLPRVGTGSPFKFELQMPEGATMDPTAVNRGAIRNWKPETHTGPIEKHAFALVRLPTPKNAYLQYGEFVKDGTYDITMVFGHDYNTPRVDLLEAEETFEHLKARGFQAPVERFADLKSDSAPFLGLMYVNGQQVSIEVRLFHADMFTDRGKQKAQILDELVKRDVFFYNGHAGPYYGFYLDGAHAADIGYLEVANAPFTDKQQLVVAQGCQTYSQYADMLYASPMKSEANLDVITTVNYSYGAGTLGLFDALTNATTEGHHEPTDAYAMVEQLNKEWINEEKEVFYGIMGITANPAVHPYAALDKIGTTCTTEADCGEPSANLCIKKRVDATKKVCAAKAVASKCPTGTYFKQIAQGSTIVAAGCVK